MSMRLRIRNFRGLRGVDWSPSGVCALTGPNGAGKTSVLEALAFLRDAYLETIGRAVDLHGGLGGFRRFDASPDEPTMFEVTADNLTWRVEPVLHGSGLGGPAGESLQVEGQAQFYVRDPNSSMVTFPGDQSSREWYDGLYLPEFVHLHKDQYEGRFPPDGEPAWHLPTLDSMLRGYRFYRDYRLDDLRRNGSQSSSHEVLLEDGRNVFSLLRNWRDKRSTRERFEFVLEGLRAAFPDMFDELDFEVAGSTVTIRIYQPGSSMGVPVEVAANGFLVALLHLCAVASMPESSVIAIDEPENGLHPFAINELLESMRARAEVRGATVLLATHSPALLNCFNGEPAHVYVMEPGLEPTPVALDEHRNPDWLAHFSLGDLFLSQDYAAPDGSRS